MIDRRKFISGVVTASTVVIAGCSGGTDNEDLAENAAEVIDDNLGLAPVSDDDPGWEFSEDGDVWFVEYWASGDPRFDFQVVGGAYAGIVDDGFEPDAGLMAAEEDGEFGTAAYDADIQREWAEDFMDDVITEEEYLDRIEDTMF